MGGIFISFRGEDNQTAAALIDREVAARLVVISVIAGTAGVGKTTLAVQILIQLLGERGERPDDPVPVLLPLSGWRADAYDGDLRDWIADRIVAGYPRAGNGRLRPARGREDGRAGTHPADPGRARRGGS